MRTDKYRYTEYVGFDFEVSFKPRWDELVAAELYDHIKDPEENQNQAGNPEYRSVREELSKRLRAGWRVNVDETGVQGLVATLNSGLWVSLKALLISILNNFSIYP